MNDAARFAAYVCTYKCEIMENTVTSRCYAIEKKMFEARKIDTIIDSHAQYIVDCLLLLICLIFVK